MMGLNSFQKNELPTIALHTWGMMVIPYTLIMRTLNCSMHEGNDGMQYILVDGASESPTHVGNDGRQFGFTIIQNCLTHLGIDK